MPNNIITEDIIYPIFLLDIKLIFVFLNAPFVTEL